MEWQHWAMIALFALAAVLPGVGILGVFRSSILRYRAYDDAPTTRDGVGHSLGQTEVVLKFLNEDFRGGPRYALRDFLLIGGGLLLGSVASVWAVVDSAVG